MKNLMAILVFGFMLLQINCSSDTPTFSKLPEEDTFEPDEGSIIAQIDILWVIDSSSSMGGDQENLANNFKSFINKFLKNEYDYKIAVTTTDAYLPDRTEFRDNNIGVKVITPDNPGTPEGTIEVFQKNIKNTGGSDTELALKSMEAALEFPANKEPIPFVRENSFFAVIIVSDEPEHSTDPIETYLEYLENLTDSRGEAKRFSVNAIAAWNAGCGSIGQRYGELVDLTGGIKGDICNQNFSADLEKISDNILVSATEYFLTRTPKPETIVVTIDEDGKEGPKPPFTVPLASDGEPGGCDLENDPSGTGGYTYNEKYDDGSKRNSITFSGNCLPKQGAKISVVFDTVTIEE